VPDKLDLSDQGMSRNIKKTIRKNLVEKMKTFGIHNNAAVSSNFILQAINTVKSDSDKNIKDVHYDTQKTLNNTNKTLNDSQKINSNTSQVPSSHDRHTRESTNQENQKRVSRKEKIIVNDERKLSKDSRTGDVKITKAVRKLSLSEGIAKLTKRGFVTNRSIAKKNTSIVFDTYDSHTERKESADTSTLRLQSQAISSPIISPGVDSNPQQPSCPKKTWPMKPGYWIKTFTNEMTEYEKSEILQYRKIYFVGTKAKKFKAGPLHEHNFGYDDDKGNYTIVTGDHVAYRYEIIESLGKGSFGNVLKWWDHKNKIHIGVKIIRNEK
jgi:hypothetical protein